MWKPGDHAMLRDGKAVDESRCTAPPIKTFPKPASCLCAGTLLEHIWSGLAHQLPSIKSLRGGFRQSRVKSKALRCNGKCFCVHQPLRRLEFFAKLKVETCHVQVEISSGQGMRAMRVIEQCLPGLVAQCSATPATVAATPPCSATPFQTQISVRHLPGMGGGKVRHQNF